MLEQSPAAVLLVNPVRQVIALHCLLAISACAVETMPQSNPAIVTGDVPTAAVTASGEGLGRNMLAAHNHYRCLHGVPPLRWSDEAASHAQNWADRGRFEHSDSYAVSSPGPMGENIAMGQPGAAEVVADWYSEEPQHNYSSNDFTSTSGHFSAMIWKDAQYLGCGRNGDLWVCNYWSGRSLPDCATPNMGGCFAAQVPPPINPAPSCN